MKPSREVIPGFEPILTMNVNLRWFLSGATAEEEKTRGRSPDPPSGPMTLNCLARYSNSKYIIVRGFVSVSVAVNAPICRLLRQHAPRYPHERRTPSFQLRPHISLSYCLSRAPYQVHPPTPFTPMSNKRSKPTSSQVGGQLAAAFLKQPVMSRCESG